MRFRWFFFVSVCVFSCGVTFGQGTGAEFRSPGDEERSLRRSRPVRESMERLRIERDKKDYDEMIARGNEMLKRTTHLASTVETGGGITEREKGQIAAIEKLAKQIRNQLGGDDDEYLATANKGPMSDIAAVQSLKNATVELNEELKKTSRFTISASAIQSSNEVLRIARYLKSGNN